MKVHPLIAAAIIAALMSLQTWTLVQVSDLREKVAVLSTRLDFVIGNTKTAQKND